MTRTTRRLRALAVPLGLSLLLVLLSGGASAAEQGPGSEALPAGDGQVLRNPVKPLGVPGTTVLVGQDAGGGGDPWLVRDSGEWVLTYTIDNRLVVRTAPALDQLADAGTTTVWPPEGQPDPENRDGNYWAPELHRLTGADGEPHWYLYYAAAPADAEPTTDGEGMVTALLDHRMYVLESEGDDPRGPYRFGGQLWTDYGIDMTVREAPDGSLFAVYAGHCVPGNVPVFGCQALWGAAMSDPTTLSQTPFVVARPTMEWEVVGQPINEGPAFLERDGVLHMIFSASFFATDAYTLGRVTLASGDDLTDPATWEGKKHPEPIFSTSTENSVYGPGHNGFFTSPDGTEDWIIYHASAAPAAVTASFGGSRTVRAQPFTFDEDTAPVLGVPVSLEEDLAPPSGDASDVRQAEDLPTTTTTGGATAEVGDDLAAVGGREVAVTTGALEDAVTVPFAVGEGAYDAFLRLRSGPDAPRVRVTPAGGTPVEADLRRDEPGHVEVPLGRVDAAGDLPVTVEVRERPGPFGVDQLRLRAVAEEAEPVVPEAPVALLLPLLAGAALAGGHVVRRRRSPA